MKLKVRKSKKENLKFWDLRTFSCEIIAENSKFAAKKFANQNKVYFDKSLKEFKLGNSRIPKAKIPPHPGPADVKQKSRIPSK